MIKENFNDFRVQKSTKCTNRRDALDVGHAYRTQIAKREVGLEFKKPIPIFRDALKTFLEWSKGEHMAKPNTYRRIVEFAGFMKELNKAINETGREKLTKSDELEWMELFETKKAEAQVIKSEIDKTDCEINKMVYELYGLTEDEIAIVEMSLNYD